MLFIIYMIDFSIYLDKYGSALKSPENDNDLIYENIARTHYGVMIHKLPEEFNILNTSCRDQNNRATCAAFVGATIIESHDYKKNKLYEPLSPEFIYYHRVNKPGSGMYGRDVFQILKDIGSVPESLYPYQLVDNKASEPSKDIYNIASRRRISDFARVKTCIGLKNALIEIGPCYLQLPIFSTKELFWKSESNEIYLSGHATTVIGYNSQGFIIKNSWGNKWNNNGTAIFPYEDWDIHLECWVPIFCVKNKKRKHKICNII